MKSTKLSIIFVLAIGVSFVAIGQNLSDSAGNLPVKDSITRAVDSVQIAQQTQATIAGVPVSQPVQTAIVAVLSAFLAVMPAVQLVLKRLPTDCSVKIAGIFGKLLDIATFFQKDISTTGGTHSDKPDGTCAPKKA